MSIFEKHLLGHFPNAHDAGYITDHYLNVLTKEHEFDLKKTLFATSICADDANFSSDFDKILSRPFTMGGLGGLPYTGYTGMIAYSHHIPDEGMAFIFYGPHIGITDEGELGKMIRPGQKALSNSCGALMLALDRLDNEEDEEVYVPLATEIDYQQTMLERSVMPFKYDIINSANPIKTITEVTYENIHKFVKKFVNLAKDEFHCEKVALLGGIIINTGPNHDEYFDVRNFEVLNVKDLKAPKLATIQNSKSFKNL